MNLKTGVLRKQSTSNFPKKEHFFTPWCVSGGKKCSFFGKFDVVCFLETHVLRFAFLPYYRRKSSSLFSYQQVFKFIKVVYFELALVAQLMLCIEVQTYAMYRTKFSLDQYNISPGLNFLIKNCRIKDFETFQILVSALLD